MIKRLLLTISALLIPALVIAALIATLTDNFNDNSIDAAKWYNNDATNVVEANGEIEITSIIGGGVGTAMWSQTTYDLTGSQATMKLVDAGNQSLASVEVRPIWLQKDGGGDTNGVLWAVKAGTIRAEKNVASSKTTLASDTYVANTHTYLKIRESGGTVYWDYSADGKTWSNFTSETVANLFVITSMEVDIQVRSSAEASTTTAKVDDFNILPSATARRIIFCQ